MSRAKFPRDHRLRGASQCQDMMISTEPAQSSPIKPGRCRPAAAGGDRLPRASRAHPASTPNRTCAATSPGAPSTPRTRWPSSVSTWSCTSGGCRKPAGSNLQPSPGGSPSRPGPIAPVSSTTSGAFTRRARPPSHSGRRITHPGLHPPAIPGAAHRRLPVTRSVRLRAGCHARPARPADLRGHQQDCRPRRGARPPGAARVRKGTKIVRVPPPPAVGRAIDQAVADRTYGPVLLNSRGHPGWAGTPPPAAFAGSPKPPAPRPPGRTRTCVVGFGEGAEHPVGDGAQMGPLLLETRCQPVVLIHRSHSPVVVAHSDESPGCVTGHK